MSTQSGQERRRITHPARDADEHINVLTAPGPLLLAATVVSLVSCASAHAAASDLNGFQFQAVALTVHENAGAAAITVERTNTERPA